jgi:Ribbon-helix-helix protein, copG family
MHKILVHLDAFQLAGLQKLKDERGAPISASIRLAVDLFLKRPKQ